MFDVGKLYNEIEYINEIYNFLIQIVSIWIIVCRVFEPQDDFKCKKKPIKLEISTKVTIYILCLSPFEFIKNFITFKEKPALPLFETLVRVL
jgi:hypothetical protein